MFSIPTTSSTKRDPIELLDPMLEHSWVLESLLGVIYDLNMDFLSDGLRVHLVLDLADKWEFTKARALVHGAIAQDVFHRKGSITERFEISLKLKDPRMAATWIREFSTKVWGSSLVESEWVLPFSKDSIRRMYDDSAAGLRPISAAAGGRIWDLGTWRYETFLKLPPTAVWALLRAVYVGTERTAQIDYNEVAEELERLLTLACKSMRWISANE
jgi:hypothetical protein